MNSRNSLPQDRDIEQEVVALNPLGDDKLPVSYGIT